MLPFESQRLVVSKDIGNHVRYTSSSSRYCLVALICPSRSLLIGALLRTRMLYPHTHCSVPFRQSRVQYPRPPTCPYPPFLSTDPPDPWRRFRTPRIHPPPLASTSSPCHSLSSLRSPACSSTCQYQVRETLLLSCLYQEMGSQT